MRRVVFAFAVLLAALGCTTDHECRDGTVFVQVRFVDSPALVDGLSVRYRLDDGPLVDLKPMVRPMGTDEGQFALEVRNYVGRKQLQLQYAARHDGQVVGAWQERLIDLQPACTVVRLSLGATPDGALTPEVPGPVDSAAVVWGLDTARDLLGGDLTEVADAPLASFPETQAQAADGGTDAAVEMGPDVPVLPSPDTPTLGLDTGLDVTREVLPTECTSGGCAGSGGSVNGSTTGGVSGGGGNIALGGAGGGQTGGAPGTGGNATGGVLASGGTSAAGGAPGTGGNATGGVLASGGSLGTGGVIGTGGVPGTGGAICALGETRCKDPSVQQTCQPSLTWGGDVTCTYDCNASTKQCYPDCKPTHTRCWSTSQEQVCDTTGHWPPPIDCGTGKDCLTAIGACRKSNGQTCTAAVECSSNLCGTSFFRDEDDDTYGNPSVTSKFCGDVPPAKWVTNNTDCCDSDAKARPNQTSSFTSPRSGCGGFDYNCDNDSTKLFTSYDFSGGDCLALDAYYGAGACTSWPYGLFWVPDVGTCINGTVTPYVPACGTGIVCGVQFYTGGPGWYYDTATYAMPCK